MRKHMTSKKGQSSLELLVTLSFGLIILLPIVVLAFIQVSTSTSTLAATEAQGAATKLADISTAVGSQGPPAKQLVLIEVPPNVKNIYIGSIPTNGVSSPVVGHEIIFVINTNAGPSYITAYTPVNVSGNLQQAIQTGTYLVNISAQNSCSTQKYTGPCVYMQLA